MKLTKLNGGATIYSSIFSNLPINHHLQIEIDSQAVPGNTTHNQYVKKIYLGVTSGPNLYTIKLFNAISQLAFCIE